MNSEKYFGFSGLQVISWLERYGQILRPRERKVLELRLGLTDQGPLSLKKAGMIMRVSKERLRQIQNRAIEKIRLQDPEVQRRLAEFYG